MDTSTVLSNNAPTVSPHEQWISSTSSEVVKISLTFGLAAATLVQCVGNISGAHMNPAVSVAMLVTRQISVLRAGFYVLAQCVGGVAGAGILYGVIPAGHHDTLGTTLIHPNLTRSQAFGVEFMITLLLVFTVFANLEPKRMDIGSKPFAIGLAVITGNLFAVSHESSY